MDPRAGLYVLSVLLVFSHTEGWGSHLNDKLGHEAFCLPHRSLDPKLLKMLEEVRTALREHGDLPVESVHQLTDCLEDFKSKSLSQNAKTVCKLQHHDVEIESYDNGRIYLKFPGGQLGNGQFKTVEQVYSYGTWDKAARATLLPPKPKIDDGYGYSSSLEPDERIDHDQIAREQFQREKETLERISKFPENNKRGLPETYFTNHNTVLQKMYDGDMSSTKKYGLTHEQLKKILLDPAEGLARLHEVGILHHDIKPENMLYDKEKQSVVYSDFGLAFEPKKGRPNGLDNYYYTPPGFSEEEEKKLPIEEQFKSDVFAQGMTFYTILHGSPPPWVDEVASLDTTKKTFGEKVPLRDEIKIKGFRALTAGDQLNHDLNPIDHLLLRSMHPDPTKRISARQFADAYDQIIHKKIDLKKNHGKPRLEITGISEFVPEYDQNKARNLQFEMEKQDPPGTYFLFPLKLQDSYHLGLAYVNSEGEVQTKRLNSDPDRPDELENELGFLKGLGTLTTPKKFHHSTSQHSAPTLMPPPVPAHLGHTLHQEKSIKDLYPSRYETIRGSIRKECQALKINENECASLWLYTSDLHKDYNDPLRGKGELTPEKKVLIDSLAGALEKLPPYEGWVHRGLNLTLEEMKQYKAGATIQESAFTSTSRGEPPAKNTYFQVFRGFNPPATDGRIPVKMIIHSKCGKSIERFSHLPYEEREILFQKNSRFKVLSVDMGYIILEESPSEGCNDEQMSHRQ